MGVTKDVIKQGDELNYPKAGDELTMHYTGTLVSDGSKFDSSVDKGRPFVFKIGLGMVIKGWDEGVMAMSLGEKSVLTITSDGGRRSAGERGSQLPARDGRTRRGPKGRDSQLPARRANASREWYVGRSGARRRPTLDGGGTSAGASSTEAARAPLPTVPS